MAHWLTWLIHVAKEYSRHVFLVHTLSLLLVIEIFVQLIHCLSLCHDDRFPYCVIFPQVLLDKQVT